VLLEELLRSRLVLDELSSVVCPVVSVLLLRLAELLSREVVPWLLWSALLLLELLLWPMPDELRLAVLAPDAAQLASTSIPFQLLLEALSLSIVPMVLLSVVLVVVLLSVRDSDWVLRVWV
jgi:hypothetical protein